VNLGSSLSERILRLMALLLGVVLLTCAGLSWATGVATGPAVGSTVFGLLFLAYFIKGRSRKT
jgi:hypothetical protein